MDVKQLLNESAYSKVVHKDISKVLREEIGRIIEDTDLVSLVAKAETEQVANQAVQHLAQRKIEARSKFPAKFDSLNQTEREMWGVLVKPSDVKDAARSLAGVSKGLTFDPYVSSPTRK